MLNSKVHSVKNSKDVIKHYRIIPYKDLVPLLKKGELSFLEDDASEPFKRSTIWRAARRLSELVGQKVVANKALYRINEKIVLEGYLFSVEAPESPSQTNTSA